MTNVQRLFSVIYRQLGSAGPAPDAAVLAEEMGALVGVHWSASCGDLRWWPVLPENSRVGSIPSAWDAFNRAGRNAPLKDPSCALSIPFPDGYDWERVTEEGERYVRVVTEDLREDSFGYLRDERVVVAEIKTRNIKHFPLAICLLIKAAREHEKENGR